MDAPRTRERDAFRAFLEKHRYTPQGRFARAGALEDKDIDALLRGNIASIWKWTWDNVKNAQDMEIVQRNINVARYQIDSCKQERDTAKAKREALRSRKQYLLESLRKAKEREKTLLTNLRVVETEQNQLIESSVDAKQREILKKAFNEKNSDIAKGAGGLVDQVLGLTTASTESDQLTGSSENPIDVLLREYRRMIKASNDADNVDFGDNDVAHLREFGGTAIAKMLFEAATMPHEGVPEDPKEAEYVAHVEENTNSSHDALVQIQSLLRHSQSEHIASFLSTQKAYAKAHELKRRIDQELVARSTPGAEEYELWGNPAVTRDANHELVVETADLQVESHVHASTLGMVSKAYEEIVKEVEELQAQKEELNQKVDLMNRFDERQAEIVAQIRHMYRRNQDLLQSLSRKQSRLAEVVAEEMAPRLQAESDEPIATWRKLMLEEVRVFATLRLCRLDLAQTQGDRPVAYEDLHINQLHDTETSNRNNGFKRVAEALEVPGYGSWKALLTALEASEGEDTQQVDPELQQLEQEINTDRAQTVPEARSLVTALQQLSEAMSSSSISRLEDVIQINNDVARHDLPALEQAIDNWYHQPGWKADAEPSHES
ncbi:hypothetical protein Poli38472_008710 [Pythium oligandrum]|uniref:Uncharacterized protein n=1 Tax=Pythium oligandrum TaxID=41045 RepID=A0A8K1C406_PYTOL|nr:hypothetical protein Poli38472_008710 [Pythium oligandrum]|eukprot:TMW56062.1 hypothetical protein Poli38472_008710 [Pythium oligandrum]